MSANWSLSEVKMGIGRRLWIPPNKIRTHLSLHKDTPISRPVQPNESIKLHPILGGLHHHYVRV
jgi:hypothetical protein